MKASHSLCLFTLLLGLLGNGTARSGEYRYDKEPILPPAPVDPTFEFDLRLDGWLVQMDVGYTNDNLGISRNAFLSLGDILSNVDWIVPLGADLRLGRVGFLPDIVAMKLSGGTTTPGPLFDRAAVDLKMAVINLPLYYRVVDEPGLAVDILGGARFLSVDLDVGLSGGPLGNRVGSTVPAGTSADIWDGVFGVRIQQNLNEKLYYSLYGDIGAGDSELTWQVWADFGMHLTENLSMSIGYRYLEYSEVAGQSSVGLSASGPIIVTNWKF